MDLGYPSDRRRAERVEKQTYARLSAESRPDEAETEHAMGVVVDVSEAGLGVRSPHRFYPGEEIMIRIAAGHQLHRLVGEVRRCEPADAGLWNVGVEFDPREHESRTFLEEFLPCTLMRQ